MISIICCYNNEQMYKNNIETPFTDLKDIVEIVGINNTDGRYSSASMAFNHTVPKCKGDVLVFLHQDIVFEGTISISEMLEYSEQMKDDEIGGLAGAKYGFDDNYTMVLEGKSQVFHGRKVDVVTECDTVDESLFIMRKETWKKNKFNEELCDGWHLYAVELCMRVMNNGGKIKVLPIHGIRHLSSGKIDYKYLHTLNKLVHVYNAQPYIWTTCTKIKTDKLSIFKYFCNKFLRITVKKILGRH